MIERLCSSPADPSCAYWRSPVRQTSHDSSRAVVVDEEFMKFIVLFVIAVLVIVAMFVPAHYGRVVSFTNVEVHKPPYRQ
jgi:hypothetical protein